MPNHKKPTALHLLNGNPGHRPLNLDEPEFIQGDAQPPEEVQQDAFALQEWQRRAPELTDLGLLRGQYATEFGEYCLQHALVCRIRARINELGLDEAIAKGYLKHLQLALVQRLRLAARFGFTPADAAGVKATPKQNPTTGAKRFLS